MRTVKVELGNRSYDIVIEPGLFASGKARALIAPFGRGDRWIIVSDQNVAPLWLDRVSDALGGKIEPIILPAGEATKSWATLETLCDQLLALEVERKDHIIALGGGVIGDIVGFAAAILKRGCGFIQIPTTLLSQVDSSVGGKTAISTKHGKNLIGAFHQPGLVLIDPEMLDTLPQREMQAGYAEVVKYGLIDDPGFFSWCEEHGAKLLAGDREAQVHAIEASVKAKARIVAADERETADLRALLNLGHTFGHALEAETGFSERLVHGEAVATGMALAHHYSVRAGLCDAEDAARVDSHLKAAGLPASLADAGIESTGERLVAHMLHDKKMTGGTLPFVLSRGIGKAFIDKSVALADVAAFLDGA
jgi:3-dehydroquinate synthase